MWVVVVFTIVYLGNCDWSRMDGASLCRVKAAPKITQAPMRYMRVTTQIDDDSREASLELNGPNGFETGSSVPRDRRTVEIPWKNIVLGPGQYEVSLRTSAGCFARDSVVVAGADEGHTVPVAEQNTTVVVTSYGR